ncbi:DUF6090 family protein [Flagellimonas sp. 2504JD4-2]
MQKNITMIKFFRHIRKSLLDQNKMGKYLKYAIGEIVLVVIGILIALQINNWNEEKKLKNEEVRFLRNFKTSLKSDIKENEWRSRQYLLAKEAIPVLLNHLEDDLPYQDSLKFYFGRITQTWTPRINNEVFETLKSNDLNLIANDSLRNKLVSYYSWSNNIVNDDINRYVSIIENASTNIFPSRFKALWNGNYEKFEIDKKNVAALELEMIPNDFNELKKDAEFLYFLRSLKNQYYWFNEVNQMEINERAMDLIKHIDAELEKRN